MALPEAVIEQLLASWPVARLATLDERGAPQQVPVVFARTGDGTLWSPVDGKPKRVTAVVVSTQHSPDVSHEKLKEFVMEEVIKPVRPGLVPASR